MSVLASELVETIKGFIEEYGDLPVLYEHWDGNGLCSYHELGEVIYFPEDTVIGEHIIIVMGEWGSSPLEEPLGGE